VGAIGDNIRESEELFMRTGQPKYIALAVNDVVKHISRNIDVLDPGSDGYKAVTLATRRVIENASGIIGCKVLEGGSEYNFGKYAVCYSDGSTVEVRASSYKRAVRAVLDAIVTRTCKEFGVM